MNEFSPEQRIAIEIMRSTGVKEPEAVARANRLAAYSLGAHMAPVLRRLCDVIAEAADVVQRVVDSVPVTCPLCLMVEWRRFTLRCDFCGVTAEELSHARIGAPG